MDGLAERIRRVADELGSLARLGELSDIAPRTLTNYVSGRNEPKASAILAIAKAARVSPEWLLTGEGPKRPEGLLAPGEAQNLHRSTRSATETLRSVGREVEEEGRRPASRAASADRPQTTIDYRLMELSVEATLKAALKDEDRLSPRQIADIAETISRVYEAYAASREIQGHGKRG